MKKENMFKSKKTLFLSGIITYVFVSIIANGLGINLSQPVMKLLEMMFG